VGTASLVFGLIVIGAGVFMTSDLLKTKITDEDPLLMFLLGFAVIPVPLFVIGGLLLRKYDKDKKKK